MSQLHQNIPKDCPRFNNGLFCNNNKCPYIHSQTEREVALISRRQQDMIIPTVHDSREGIDFKWKTTNYIDETDLTRNNPDNLGNYQPRSSSTCSRQVVPAMSPNISTPNSTVEKTANRAYNDSPPSALTRKNRSNKMREAFGDSIDHQCQNYIKKGNEMKSRMKTESSLRTGIYTSPPTDTENSSLHVMSHPTSRDRCSALPPKSLAPMSRDSPSLLDSKKKIPIDEIPKSFINTNSRPPALRNDLSVTRNSINNSKFIANGHETPLNGSGTPPSQINTRTTRNLSQKCCKEGSKGESFLYAKRTFAGLLAQVGKNSTSSSQCSNLRKTNGLMPENKISLNSENCDYPKSEKICSSDPKKSDCPTSEKICPSDPKKGDRPTLEKVCSPVSEGNNSWVSGRSNSSVSERSNSSVSRRSNSSVSDISISLVLKKDTSSVLEKSDNREVCIIPQTESDLTQVVEDISSDSGEIPQYQEDPNLWDDCRFEWYDTIQPKNKKIYIQDKISICNGTRVRSYNYNNKALMKALLGSSAEKKTFPQFMKLPAEIRNQIWSYSKQNCARTCYVELGLKQEIGGIETEENGKHELLFNPVTDAKFSYLYDIPGLFGACRESRSFVKDFYGKPKMAAVNVNTQKPFPSGQGSCIFNYDHDRLFFITRSTTTQLPDLVQYMRREERSLIKHLAIPLKDYFFQEDTVVECLTHFPSLQTLDMVIGDGKDDLNRLRNLDYAQHLSDSLKEQYLINDRELDLKDRKKWTVPKVKIEVVNEVQAHIWKIDDLKWNQTSRPIPRPLILA